MKRYAKFVATHLSARLFAVLLLFVVSFDIRDAKSQEELTIAMGPWPGFDVIWYGVSEGLFEDRGLNVRIRRMNHQQDATRALMRGRVDGAFTSLWDLAIAKANPVDANIVLVTNVSHGSDGVVALPGVPDLKSLRGKTIASKIGTINHLILLEALHHGGLRQSDVKIRNVPNDVGFELMDRGEVDAAVLWEPMLSRAQTNFGCEVLFTTADVESLVIDVLAANPTSLEEKRDAWVQFFLVWFDIMAAMDSDPQAVADVVGKVIGQAPEEFLRDYSGLVSGSIDLNRQFFGPEQRLRDVPNQMKELLAGFSDGPSIRDENILVESRLLLEAIDTWTR